MASPAQVANRLVTTVETVMFRVMLFGGGGLLVWAIVSVTTTGTDSFLKMAVISSLLTILLVGMWVVRPRDGGRVPIRGD